MTSRRGLWWRARFWKFAAPCLGQGAAWPRRVIPVMCMIHRFARPMPSPKFTQAKQKITQSKTQIAKNLVRESGADSRKASCGNFSTFRKKNFRFAGIAPGAGGNFVARGVPRAPPTRSPTRLHPRPPACLATPMGLPNWGCTGNLAWVPTPSCLGFALGRVVARATGITAR